MGMMGPAGMMGMAMHGRTSAAEAPWISLALEHSQELGLSAEQVRKLEGLRAGFEKQAIRQSADIRIAELELSELLGAEPVDLSKVQAKLRQADSLRSELRMGRIRTLEEGKAELTAEQREQLKQRLSETGIGGTGMQQMHEFMQSDRMPRGMMEMAARMGNGDPMAGMVRMMEMMGSMDAMMRPGMMGSPEATK